MFIDSTLGNSASITNTIGIIDTYTNPTSGQAEGIKPAIDTIASDAEK
jgi:hypothetical protein